MSINGALELLVARKWLAGPTIKDAVLATKKINKRHVRGLINYLGEEYKDENSVQNAVDLYLELIEEVHRNKLIADITIKPTQIGLLKGKAEFENNYNKIITLAKSKGVYVWFDMEESWSVPQTIKTYLKFVKTGNTGICIQTYLKRGISDVKLIVSRGGNIRLVKGAHKVPKTGGYATREESTDNFVVIMEYLFKHSKRFTLGTHDSMIIEKALKLNKRYKRQVTYAMLTGIRNDYAFELAEKGENVAIYVTFGAHWISYTYRRLKEMNNLKLIVRSLFGG